MRGTIFGILSLAPGESTTIPHFDKAIDDRVPESQWSTVRYPIDLVIVEGWCVGCKPVRPDQLKSPINTLEELEDKDVHGATLSMTALYRISLCLIFSTG